MTSTETAINPASSNPASSNPYENDPIQPYKGDPWLANLSTPINDSPIVNAFIRNLPAYRPGLTPFMRGLEIGMAHGYFLVGARGRRGAAARNSPRRKPERLNYCHLHHSFCVSGHLHFASATFQGDPRGTYNSHSQDDLRPLRKKEDWFQLGGGILLGATGGALFAYALLENFDDLDAILRGKVNVGMALSQWFG
ncbi:MAG: photosystem I reaction center protein subunit XI [Leptolyngbyaceae cyanobacterium SU_3_3]|nr:photosystem I reaction center protein subunit XI [Leptolyngbyaceae cyanobacterium SU_3_3]